MESGIFKFIFKYSKKEQILLLLMTLVSFPFLYFSLDLPKIIVNEAIGGNEFPRRILGFELQQIPYLLALCCIFLTLVFINGGFKYVINVYRGVVGERMLRRLRYALFNRVLRFPLPHFRRISQGEIVSMITAETEPLGGFVGDSVALPAFQGGTLLTILVFMFIQDIVLGIAAISLYPIQLYIIPKLQRKLNELKKQRIIKIRRVSERIGEVVSGIREVHAHDTSQLELADYSERMHEIYHIRYRLYKIKFLIKFLNNFLAQLTPFFFFAIGGYLVIKGDLTFGALVAVLAAYKDLSAPWKELLNYYQQLEDARIKYDLLAETFQPADMLDEELQSKEAETPMPLTGELIASNVSLSDEGQESFSGGANFRIDLGKRVAVLGPSGSGKHRLAMIIARLISPSSGRLSVGGANLATLPESVTGRRIAYVDQESRLRAGTLGDNLFYSLKHRPLRPVSYAGDALRAREKYITEARHSGNTDYDVAADWVDYEAASDDRDSLIERAIDVLTLVDMDQDVYQFGLRSTLDPDTHPELAERIMAARTELGYRLQDPEIAPLVEPFDRDKYNTNMTVAENLLFGTPRDPSYDIENLSANQHVRDVLQDKGLRSDFLTMGRELAELMVDLFVDVPADSELFEQYSFIDADDLPAFRSLLKRSENLDDLNELEVEDRIMLRSLPLKLVPARHRLGLIDERMEARLLEARRALAENFTGDDPPVELFDRSRYNRAVSIQDNILFGRLAYGKARSAARIGGLIREVIDKLGLRRAIMEIGLDYPVGISGARLNTAQRQKLAIARCVLKRPDIMIIDEATAALDGATQGKIMKNLFDEFADGGLIWVLHRASLGEEFDYTLVLEDGKVVAQGGFAELDRPGSLLNQLVAAG